MTKLAVILIRGLVGVDEPKKNTLKRLCLSRKNQCVVVEDNEVNKGMIKKVKDLITWGELNEETYQKMLESRGEEYKGRTTDSKGLYKLKFIEENGKKYKKVFRLNPPIKGFSRGIKVGFGAGGTLGYRKDKINDLILRMI
jgi:large subunit ribosomal protein L30